MKAPYLICYDITEPKRLAKVFKYMKGKGIHLQYSVFHCLLTWHELMIMKHELRKRIEETEDDVRIYPLPSSCKVIIMGLGSKVPKGVQIFI